MGRSAAITAAAAIIGGLVVFAALGNVAKADASRVICTQVPQKPGQLDEQYIADFMGDQLVAGRKRFTTVTGTSTVLCAW